ncbi:MAG: hypothetical protein HZA66_18975 [Rhodopseudomonas palustris]|uniref:Transposase (putative) YhgA-like domain-containing protein n=1 Tax=Rhodopseudomonas palustris TaxID=1076 RepID=A0A933W2G1_RHOPL|nr:hypothetical protein [Rhodopseudomonas palustris]
MGRYDISLKAVLKRGNSRILGALGMPGAYRELSPEFPSMRKRTADFLAVVKQPRKRPLLAQVELQTSPDTTMMDRMLRYSADIRIWASSQNDLMGLSGHQTILYVGTRSWKPRGPIDEQNLWFKPDFVDARDINPEPLLASENLGDVTFAVLCRDGNRPHVIKKVLERIVAAPAADRPDGVAMLSVFSDLRHIGAFVQAEMDKMGISVDLEDSTLVRPTIDRARRKTAVELIIRSLRARFAGQVPDDLPQQLEQLSMEALQEAFDRSTMATSVDDIVAAIAPRSIGPKL